MAKSSFTSFDNLTLQGIEAEAELIPLLTTEDEEALRNEVMTGGLPQFRNAADNGACAADANFGNCVVEKVGIRKIQSLGG